MRDTDYGVKESSKPSCIIICYGNEQIFYCNLYSLKPSEACEACENTRGTYLIYDCAENKIVHSSDLVRLCAAIYKENHKDAIALLNRLN